jgi:hypothetical protein
LSSAKIPVRWFIDGPKVTAYLLNRDHPIGRGKAEFLLGFGFSLDAPAVLAEALVDHAMLNMPGRTVPQPRGPHRAVFEGMLLAPDGREMPLRTVWEIGEYREMRFITAVPLTR